MKRKSIALLLALMMCLALLSACGGDNTPETPEPPSTESTAQPPADGKEEQPTQEPKQGEPTQEDSEESPEPTQQEPEEVDNAGTAFLKLLQEEYQNGFIRGERPGWSYYKWNSTFGFVRDGVVYIWYDLDSAFSYDIVSKVLSQWDFDYHLYYDFEPLFIRNDSFYFSRRSGLSREKVKTVDFHGEHQKALIDAEGAVYGDLLKGILLQNPTNHTFTLYSYDFEKLAEIPLPQHEVAHGLTETIPVNNQWSLDGTLYIQSGNNTNNSVYYRLNMDTYEWEECEKPLTDLDYFCGKYGYKKSVIYDSTTGEQVFDCNEAGVYPPADFHSSCYYYSCYFGGDKYLGSNNGEYRWVNLTDLSMSDPLQFPKLTSTTPLCVLNDTYCVYKDRYGWFLLNYNTGEEETIMLFEN